MIGSDKSATRFAGQIGNISQFLPQDGLNPSETAKAVLNANSMKKNSGLLAQAEANKSIIGTTGLVQGAHQKARIPIAEGKLAATKILTQGASQTAQQDAAGDAAYFGGMVEGFTGLATGGLGAAQNAGMFGGTGTMDNPFGADKDAGTAGYIDFGTGSGVNYADKNGRILR